MNAQGLSDFFSGMFRRVDMLAIAETASKLHADDMIDLNRKQLQDGINADGQAITPEYKDSTKVRKRQKGQPDDRVTLADKKNFYGGFYAKTERSGTDISSGDYKTPFLVRKYRETIFGLSVASKEQLRDRMKPTFQSEYKSQLIR